MTTKTPEYDPSNHTILTCAPRLRWVERDGIVGVKALGSNYVPGGLLPEPPREYANVLGLIRVLQQAWHDQSTGAIVWKDVPVEKES